MHVKVVDILTEPIKATHLKGIDKLAFDSSIRGKIVSMWDDRDKVTVHLWGPFVVAGDAVTRDYAWRRAVIKEPNGELR